MATTLTKLVAEDQLTDRDREELEVLVVKEVVNGNGRDIECSLLAIKVKDYFEALKAQGFSSDVAERLIGTTIQFLLR